MSAGRRSDDAHRRADPVPGNVFGLLGPEPVEAGDRRRAWWTIAVAQHPRLGAAASISRSTIGRSAAGRAWCCGRSRWSNASRRCRGRAIAPGHLVLLTPQGRRLDQRVVEELAGHQRLVLICGRYEGVDQRAIDLLRPDEMSIGDFILGGGEVAAMVVIDAVVRLVPGVLGDEESNKQDSFSGEPPLLEFAQYTRPREYRGLNVPDVLMTGNHPEIARWREQQKLERTRERRADLLDDDIRNNHEGHKEHKESDRLAISPFVPFVTFVVRIRSRISTIDQ